MTADALADRLNLRPGLRDSGLAYCRRASRTNKAEARNQVLSRFSGRYWPQSLSILTMPSLDWRFERSLINDREHGRGTRSPRRTHITAVERSPFIFQAATVAMPGSEDSLSCAIPCPPFARNVVRSLAIARFYECSVADLAAYRLTESHYFDAAWIDLTGPLSFEHLDTLVNLWQRTRSVLVVTSLRARWASDFTDAMTTAGSISELLCADLRGSVVESELAYMDTSPMHQMTLRRA